ncbi:hypothetical protein BKA80DRAFT_17753 [Phyllosticta citrichinensis]
MISQKVDKRRSDSSMAPREIIYQRVLADLMLNALLDSKEPSSAKDFGERRPKPLAYQKALRAARQTNPPSSACSGLPTLIDASHMRRSPRGARVERRRKPRHRIHPHNQNYTPYQPGWLKFPRRRADRLLERVGPGGCPANGADGGDVKDLSVGMADMSTGSRGVVGRRWSRAWWAARSQLP